MRITELTAAARDTMTARRVYAEPYEKDGVTIIAAALVAGGGGGGNGRDEQGQQGEGAGFGLAARPVGAYIITGGQVRWRPAIDVNRLVSTVGAVLIAALLAGARIVRSQARAGRRG